MIIKVDKNFVDFDNVTNINKNEYNVTELRFQFSKEYEGLTCKAIFKKVDDDVYYERAIIDNKCEIPSEVLDGVQILIGVYAYELKNNELIKRYSPSPKKIVLLEGSYYDGASTPEEITPSQFEQYTAYLNSQIERLNKVKIETKELSDGVKISVTNVDGKVTETEVYNGETGPQGPQGEPGATGAPGRDGYVQYTAGENITIENNVISASGESYTAGDNITIEDGVISATDTTYTAGTGIDITNNVISASGGSGEQSSFVFHYGETSATSIATAQQIINYYNKYGVFPLIYYTSTNNSSYAAYNIYYSVRLNGYTANSRRYEFQVYRITGVSSQYSGGNTLGCYGKIYIILNSDNLTVSNVTLPNSSYTSNNQVRDYTIPILYKKGNAMSSIQSYLDADSVLPINNSETYVPTGNYNPSTKLYTDKTHYENMSGYDATKTQILKNINGTLTWVDE